MPTSVLFPDFPLTLNLLAAVGLILTVGILGARLATRLLPVPAITGYVLTGLLLGPAVLNLVDTSMLNNLNLLVDTALGLILFELGRRVDIGWLLREKRLLATALILCGVTFVSLFGVLVWFGVGKLIACIVAATGMASSPAVALHIVKETRAEGQLSERLLNIVVIGNALAFVAFSMGLAAMHVEYDTGWRGYLLHPLYLLAGSALLGWLASWAMILLGERLGRDKDAQMILAVALIAATVGLAVTLKLSALIALLAFGIASRHHDSRHALLELDFGQLTALLYVLLFVAAGASLELVQLRTMLPVALAFVLVRSGLMTLTTTLLSKINGLTRRKGALLGVALAPLSGMKIILVHHGAGAYPEFGAQLAALTVSILVILELAGPICTRLALVASGEAKS